MYEHYCVVYLTNARYYVTHIYSIFIFYIFLFLVSTYYSLLHTCHCATLHCTYCISNTCESLIRDQSRHFGLNYCITCLLDDVWCSYLCLIYFLPPGCKVNFLWRGNEEINVMSDHLE